MRLRVLAPVAVLFALPVLALLALQAPNHTLVKLADARTGTALHVAVLAEGDRVTLTWMNSLFRQTVVETFYARDGLLVQDSVTFVDPLGREPPVVSAGDVADLYHTGGAFTARGLERPFNHIVYSVGEIGDPVMVIGAHTVQFKSEVGFGGRVALDVRRARLIELLGSRLRR